MENKRKYWLWFTRINGIGIKKQRQLLNFCHDPEQLFYMSMKTLRGCFMHRPLKESDVQAFEASRDMKKLDAYEQRLHALGIGYVTLEEELYPRGLMSLYDPPYVLYYRGTLRAHKLSIGMVGSRRCTAYGRKVAEKLSRDLAQEGVNIISGLARGIDTYSHQGAIEIGGFTTAVLGCGINICYPKENKMVMKEIIHKGCIISEYGLDIPPKQGYFPMRNRLISGLSQGVLLVEAKKRSGSLITVDCALDIGRDVFAVPGDVLGISNEGSNNVIRLGGKPVFCAKDVLEEYNEVHVRKREIKGVRVDEEASELELNKLESMSEEERTVYDEIGQMPLHIDEISLATGLDIGDLQFVLTKLEIMDMVIQLPGKHYIIGDDIVKE